jgi:predicted SAM-dependent methyltransferase/rubredoxin
MLRRYIRRLKRAIHSFQREMRTDNTVPFIGDRYRCPVCDVGLRYYDPVDKNYLAKINDEEYNWPITQLETFNIANYYCPNCGANDRERLYAVYFEKRMADTDKSRKYRMVDFAPSWSMAEYFRRKSFLEYRTADLYKTDVDDKVDITHMDIYADGTFDIFLCSHVLEHIEDDHAAMRELHRILKPGGWGIAMVPIYRGDRVVEALVEVQTEADRWKYYGQGDHVRYYNRAGFVDRLQHAGFRVNLVGIDHLGADVFDKCGIHPRSFLYIVQRS